MRKLRSQNSTELRKLHSYVCAGQKCPWQISYSLNEPLSPVANPISINTSKQEKKLYMSTSVICIPSNMFSNKNPQRPPCFPQLKLTTCVYLTFGTDFSNLTFPVCDHSLFHPQSMAYTKVHKDMVQKAKETQISKVCGFLALPIQNFTYCKTRLIKWARYNQAQPDDYDTPPVLRQCLYV